MTTGSASKEGLRELSRKYVLEQIKDFGTTSSIKSKDVQKAVTKVSRVLDEIRSAHLALKK